MVIALDWKVAEDPPLEKLCRYGGWTAGAGRAPLGPTPHQPRRPSNPRNQDRAAGKDLAVGEAVQTGLKELALVHPLEGGFGQ
jgi:hypothetical protein